MDKFAQTIGLYVLDLLDKTGFFSDINDYYATKIGYAIIIFLTISILCSLKSYIVKTR